MSETTNERSLSRRFEIMRIDKYLNHQDGQRHERLSWIVADGHNAIEFHVDRYLGSDEDWEALGSYSTYETPIGRLYIAGIEMHSCQGEGEPDHTDCRVLGGNCWHDGTSLWASRFMNGAKYSMRDDLIYAECEQWWHDRFQWTEKVIEETLP